MSKETPLLDLADKKTRKEGLQTELDDEMAKLTTVVRDLLDPDKTQRSTFNGETEAVKVGKEDYYVNAIIDIDSTTGEIALAGTTLDIRKKSEIENPIVFQVTFKKDDGTVKAIINDTHGNEVVRRRKHPEGVKYPSKLTFIKVANEVIGLSLRLRVELPRLAPGNRR